VRFIEEERWGLGALAGLLLALAVLTKQTACVLGLVWAVYALWQRGGRIVRHRGTLAALAILAALLVPYGILTIKYSPVNVGQSIGGLSGGMARSRSSWTAIRFYVAHAPDQVGWLCLGLALAGVALALARPLWRGRKRFQEPPLSPEKVPGTFSAAAGLGAAWVVVCYLVFTVVIAHKDWRFILLWVPGFALLAAVAVEWLWRAGRLGRALAVAGLLAALGQAGQQGMGGPARRAPQVEGTDALARHLAESPSGTVVFYAGWFNGNFVFHMRQHDPEGRVVVLSGTKMLVVTLAEKEHGMKVLVTTPEGILEVFRKYGVRYVALEDPSPKLLAMAEIFTKLRELVRTDRFALRQVFPVTTNLPHSPPGIALYEYLDAGPAQAQFLEIEIPAAGQNIAVPLRRLGVPTVK
jgi:hypothetical protein